MLNPIQILLRFLFRHSATFLVIVVTLIAGVLVQKELAEYTSTSDAINALKRGKAGLEPYVRAKKEEVIERVKSFEKAALKGLNDRISAIDKEIAQKSASRQLPDIKRCVLLGGDPDGHSKCSTYGQSNCSTPATVN